MTEQREDAALKDSIWYRRVFDEIRHVLGQDEKSPVLVAIDGQCTSGKTTLARLLAQEYDCNVFHMDDFFLRPEQKTQERLAEVGGNVDYERFREEVLTPVLEQRPAAYRRYSCSRQALAEEIHTAAKRLNIIEGSYSLHSYFGKYYDLAYCLMINPEEQKKRILQRNGESMLPRFISEWIPKENAYLEQFQITANAVVLSPDQEQSR